MSEKQQLWNGNRKEFIRRVIRKEGAPVTGNLSDYSFSPPKGPTNTNLVIRKPRRDLVPFEVESVGMSDAARERIADLVRVVDLAFKPRSESPGRALVTHMKSLKDGAAGRSLEFSLSDTEMSEMMNLPCDYCGIRERHRYNGIDRVDNSLGYTKENCVPCCRWCNYAKGIRHVDDFMAWLRWVAWESPLATSAPTGQPEPVKPNGRLRSRDHAKMVPLSCSAELSATANP